MYYFFTFVYLSIHLPFNSPYMLKCIDNNNIRIRNYHVAPSFLCSHTCTPFWLRKTSVIVDTYHLSLRVFIYAFHLEISSFFGKSFLFLFLFVCVCVCVLSMLLTSRSMNLWISSLCSNDKLSFPCISIFSFFL